VLFLCFPEFATVTGRLLLACFAWFVFGYSVHNIAKNVFAIQGSFRCMANIIALQGQVLKQDLLSFLQQLGSDFQAYLNRLLYPLKTTVRNIEGSVDGVASKLSGMEESLEWIINQCSKSTNTAFKGCQVGADSAFSKCEGYFASNMPFMKSVCRPSYWVQDIFLRLSKSVRF
jgi:hypothetical protein